MVQQGSRERTPVGTGHRRLPGDVVVGTLILDTLGTQRLDILGRVIVAHRCGEIIVELDDGRRFSIDRISASRLRTVQEVDAPLRRNLVTGTYALDLAVSEAA